MSLFNFSQQHIQGLFDGNEQVLRDVLSQVRQVVAKELQRRRLSEDIYEEVASSIYSYAVTSVQEGFSLTGNELSRRLTLALKQMVRSYEGNTRRSPSLLKRSDKMVDSKEHELARRLSREGNAAEKFLSKLEEIEQKYEDDLIYKSQETDTQTKEDFLAVDDELIRFFKRHPEEIYKLNPRRFEELVAAILEDLGYDVELTAQSADGGIDIIATQKIGIGEVLLLVDCKRYAPARHVGVEIVRSMYGISEQQRATMAMIATTSYFTRPALEFQRTVRHRLSLKDYDDLNKWLTGYGKASQ